MPRQRRRIVLDALRQSGRPRPPASSSSAARPSSRSASGLVALVQPGQVAGPLGGLGRGLAGAGPLPGQELVDLGAAAGDRLGVLGGREPGPISAASPTRSLAPAISPAGAPAAPGAGPARADRGPAPPGPPGSARQASTAAAMAARSASSPPKASSSSRCQRSSRSRCWSCWPWISTSRPATADKPRGRDRLVVDAGRGAPRRGHLADADERLRQPVEERLDPGRVRAVADQRSVRPRPDRQPQGVDQEALAGAGLAGEDVEPRLEGDAQLLDQGQVADRELGQASGGHRPRPRSRARSPAGLVLGPGVVFCNRLQFGRVRHDGSSSDFWRSRSQNGTAPRGSMKRTGCGSLGDRHHVADGEPPVLAAVDAHQHVVGVHDAAPDRVARAHHDRSDGGEIAGDRRHDQVPARRIDDRAAGRERVAGRAGRAARRPGRPR